MRTIIKPVARMRENLLSRIRSECLFVFLVCLIDMPTFWVLRYILNNEFCRWWFFFRYSSRIHCLAQLETTICSQVVKTLQNSISRAESPQLTARRIAEWPQSTARRGYQRFFLSISRGELPHSTARRISESRQQKSDCAKQWVLELFLFLFT